MLAAYAQSDLNYRRNSLATMLVFHPEDEFGEEIYKAFDSLPIPDKYDDHTIEGARVIESTYGEVYARRILVENTRRLILEKRG